MKNRLLKIPLHDGKLAYAKMQGDFKQPLIVFVHGLTSNMDRLLPHTSANFFAENGYSFLRFNLYDWREDARDLWDCTLQVHAKDLDSVIKYCREQGAGTVHVMGHSYGGLTIFMSEDRDFASAIMCDPSHPLTPPFGDKKNMFYVREIDGYVDKSGVDYVFSSRLVEERKALNKDRYLEGYIIPTIIFSAGNGVLVEAGKDYENSLKEKTRVERHLIKDADHSFTENEHCQEMLNLALNWLESFN